MERDREPPHSIEAEQALLGALLMRNDLIEALGAGLRPQHFYARQHETIYESIIDLRASGKPADPITLRGQMGEEAFAAAGGHKYLAALVAHAGLPVNVPHYAETIVTLGQRRALIEIGESLQNGLVSEAGDKTTGEIVSDLRSRLEEIQGVPSAPVVSIEPVDIAAWAGREPPPREWLVEQWIPKGYSTGLYGDGGTGKTLAAQQLLTACATGQNWLSIGTAPARGYGLFCEDDADELWRRQVAINKLYDCSMGDLSGRVRLVSRYGHDNVLMDFARLNRGETTALLDALIADILEWRAEIVVLDTVADLFAGNDNDATEVRQFGQACLGRIIRETGATLLCLKHPSYAGMDSGEGTGGSVQWNAVFRSRLYLEHMKAEGDDRPDPDLRVLARKKANLAARNERIDLRWSEGAFAVEYKASGSVEAIEDHNIDKLFLTCLGKMYANNQIPSDTPNSANFAPRVMMTMAAVKNHKPRIRQRDLQQAMYRLFDAGAIKKDAVRDVHRNLKSGIVTVGDDRDQKDLGL